MKFYHGTTKENYGKILEEGILFGRRYIIMKDGTLKEVGRATYLATDIEEARCYGDIVLEVEYDAIAGRKKLKNNYCDGCWQVRVYEPIPLENIRIVK